MSSPSPALRQRAGKETKKANGKVDAAGQAIQEVWETTKQEAPKEWDYKVALGIISVLAFVTRFYLIHHPNEVVFDEVHFGKVGERANCICFARTNIS